MNKLLLHVLLRRSFLLSSPLSSSSTGCILTDAIIKPPNGSPGKELTVVTSSLRIDTIAAVGLSISRRKLWEIAIDGRGILLNGSPVKKSTEIKQGDIIEVDMPLSETKPLSETNKLPSCVVKRGRVVVMEIGPPSRKGRQNLTIKRWRQYMVYKR